MANNKENELDKQDSAEVKNYTRTPNMLIFGYNNISPQEKWLYVCLKHMCGKRGTRHLSLRYISEQTGISVGALSRSKDKKGNINEGMIKHLHDAGLIHAEIKKLNGKGNPLYHITITDVWGLNQAFFTRPNSEQDESEENEPVRIPDVPVQNSDKLARNSDKPVQISDEPVRKPLQYQDYIQDYKQDDNNTREQEESNSDDTTKHTFVSSDTARAEYPLITFADCLTYLQEQGVAPRGEDAVQVMVQARTLYAHKHPRYEYRARPGLSEHPDDQLPGKTEEFIEKLREWRSEDEQALPSQDEQVFTDNEPPQGDDHATAASGHSHRLDDAAARGDDTSHSAMAAGQVATSETRPVLEAQEIDNKGEHHGHRVPTVPAANPAAPGERAVSRSGSDHSRDITHPGDDLPVVRAVGSSTPCSQADRDTGDAGRDTAQALAQTPTTPMPAQSLSLPQAEQAASGLTFVEARDYLRSLGYFLEPVPAMNGNWEIREPGERGFSVICGDEVRGIAEYQRKKREQAAPGQSTKGKGKKQAEPKPETPKGPPVAPPADMAWGTRKCLMWFDFWRGGILIGKWKLMQASTCAKGLAEQFDEQTVIQARTDMEADPYYAAKGGCDVCDVANNIHKYLKRRQGKHLQLVAAIPASKPLPRIATKEELRRIPV